MKRPPGYGSEGAAISAGAFLQSASEIVGGSSAQRRNPVVGSLAGAGRPVAIEGVRSFTPVFGISLEAGDPRPLCEGAEDPDLFFSFTAEARLEALSICSSCPLREACSDAADASGANDGVWGGLTAPERRRVKRRKRLGLTA